jgi:predicted  nucleic acid-binding Zn-ribbon protein
MTTASDLLGLQEIDLLRDKNRAQLADIDARLIETEELIAARQAVEDAAADLDALRKDQRAIETQIADLDAKINPLEKKLYGGSVRNPKELSDLQKESEILKAQRSKIEDRGLEYVEAVESAEADLKAARAALAAIEASWKDEQAGLRNARLRIERDDEQLTTERNRRATGVQPVTLAEYEKNRHARQGRAVARIERGTCSGCRISLPTNLVQKVRAATSLIQCPSCERILVP